VELNFYIWPMLRFLSRSGTSLMRPTVGLALALMCLALCSSCSRNPSYYVDRGNGFFANKNYEDAGIQYRKALQQDPKFAEAQGTRYLGMDKLAV